MSDRQKKEYLREGREPVANSREEREWQDLEKKLDPETIDCRPNIQERRKWFMDMFEYAADDETVNITWEAHHDNTKR